MTDNGSNLSGLWEDCLARFFMGLLGRRVVSGKRLFDRVGEEVFLGFIKPKRVEQAEQSDVEEFLALLARKGKKGWRVGQANPWRIEEKAGSAERARKRRRS